MTDQSPLVSAVLIFLDAERHLPEAIESVLAQSYRSWELLLVDDGSRDNSAEIALSYVDSYPDRIRYLHHAGRENRGMSASRNLGIERSRGSLIAFLDADDVWLPKKLERQVSLMTLHEAAGMVYGNPEYWYEWRDGENGVMEVVPPLPTEADTLVYPPTLLLRSHPLGNRSAPCPSDLMIRRRAIEEVNGFEEHFRGALQLYEDQAFLVKIYLKQPVFVSGECWLRYRKHAHSCTSRIIEAGECELVRGYFLRWLESYLAREGIRDARVWRAYRKGWRSYRYPRVYRLLQWARSNLRWQR